MICCSKLSVGKCCGIAKQRFERYDICWYPPIDAKHYKGYSASLTATPRVLGKSQSYFCTPAIAHAALTLIRQVSECSTLTFRAEQKRLELKIGDKNGDAGETVCKTNAEAGHASQEGQVENLVPENASDDGQRRSRNG